MDFRNISEKDYELIIKLDKKVYPTSSPVTLDIIGNWFQRNPEFGVIFKENNKVKGICITIPLNKDGWTRLIKGELSESQLDEKTIFDNFRDDEIGLHIYHIERFGNQKGFYKTALENLSNTIKDLKEENPKLEIKEFSGLCVTRQGIGLFEKLECKEVRLPKGEYILNKENNKIVVGERDLKKRVSEGWKIINRCQMRVSYPKEDSLVWKYLRR